MGSFHRHATTATVSAITHVFAAHYTQHRSVDNHHMIRWSMVTLSRAQHRDCVHLAGLLPLLAPRHGASTTAVPFVRSLVAPETGVLRELAAVLMQRNRLRCYFPSGGQEILFFPSGTVRKTDLLEKQGPPNLAQNLKYFFISERQEEATILILIGDVCLSR